MNGLKEQTTQSGEKQKFTRRLYPGDIYLTEKPQEMPTTESAQQWLDDWIDQNLQKPSSNTSGKDGYASLVRSYQTLVRIADYLLVVLALTLLIVLMT